MNPQEIDRELTKVIAERDKLLARSQRGEMLRDEIATLTDLIRYSQRAWERERWPRYFRPYEGAIHNRPRCRGMKREAPLLAELSGVSDLGVVARYGRLCAHCLLRTGRSPLTARSIPAHTHIHQTIRYGVIAGQGLAAQGAHTSKHPQTPSR